MSKRNQQLPKVAFSILLALALRQRHGYEIIKQVEEDSMGAIKLGPGALYTSIKQLREQDLIAEVTDAGDTRRRYYKLTETGLNALTTELEYYQRVVNLANQRQSHAT
jgi:DNA-binding PadR family transcriptional regulator